jgi:peptide/nickel transport system ATP-binding protein
MPDTADKLLSVNDLTVTFRTEDTVVTAVSNVGFHIDEGEILGLVGESGSGKSVTGMSLLRLIPTPPGKIESGSAMFGGRDLLRLTGNELRRVRGREIGIIFQEPMTALSPLHTIGDQLAESLLLHQDMSKQEAWQKSIEWLDKVGIPDPEQRMGAFPFQFSGGMRQRAMIAMVLMLNPRLIIADEPTTALDVTTQRQIFELVLKMKKDKTSLLFITHDMGVIWQLCDRVLVMKDAEIVEEGPTDSIFLNPSHPYSRELLEAVPRLNSPPRNPRLEIRTRPVDPVAEPPEEALPLVTITNLKTWFPIRRGVFARTVGYVKAVNGVSLCIKAGETLALVGESGSGKTTLGRSILGLDKAMEGEILFRHTNLLGASRKIFKPLRRNLQTVFQDPFSSLNPRMTVIDIVTEGLIEHRQLEESKDDAAVRILEEVGLEADHRHRYPHEFSGGQRQRICIARAISLKPEFIVCDEAVSALDVTIQAQILDLLIELQEKYNLSYLFITHDLGVVKEIADRVAVMKNGSIVEEGTTAQVIGSPRNQYTKELIAAVPIPGDKQNRLYMRNSAETSIQNS